jgi:erythromycin esterase-like protein
MEPGRTGLLPLRDPADLDPLLDRIGYARFVLIGEASHGTAEFYRWREQLTRRLVAERGFDFVAVEGDWPDCHTVNESVTGAHGAPADPREALEAFHRWPTWMWANEEVVAFARWLRTHNDALPPDRRVGFHGLDVYSLWESLREVIDYLQEHEPEHLDAALAAFRCFEPFDEDPQTYAAATRLVPTSCEQQVVELLQELRLESTSEPCGRLDPAFVAEQNAMVAADAERYYRAMVRGGPESWNIRDCHMADTLDRLAEHYGPGTRAVVWEHNTHVGDARATAMRGAGMVNVGQLERERREAGEVVLVGFGSHHGSVIASDRWGGPVRTMAVPPARPGSVEGRLHQAGAGADGMLLFGLDGTDTTWSERPLEHRAIGVVYHPERERRGNYVSTILAGRYDAFLHVDETTALHPLHLVEPADTEPETFPWGT